MKIQVEKDRKWIETQVLIPPSHPKRHTYQRYNKTG